VFNVYCIKNIRIEVNDSRAQYVVGSYTIARLSVYVYIYKGKCRKSQVSVTYENELKTFKRWYTITCATTHGQYYYYCVLRLQYKYSPIYNSIVILIGTYYILYVYTHPMLHLAPV